MKSVFPVSKDYDGDVVKTAQAPAAAIRPALNPTRPMEPTGPVSKYSDADLQTVNQAHDLLTKVTARVNQAGGVHANVPQDLEISKAFNRALGALESLQVLLEK